MKRLNRKNAAVAKVRPERIIQFGEGNFLRAFVDWIVFNMNEKAAFNSSVVAVQPIENGMVDILNEQDGLYHLNLQGIDNGRQVDSIQLIDVISRGLNPYTQFEEYLKLAENPEMRFVISNTTEAGIAFCAEDKLDDKPAKSYPGKLTQLLYHRFKAFGGDPGKGFIILPCELIFHNGAELKKCIEQYIDLWELGAAFKAWFASSCSVYSTLVDRIVPGYPKDSINEILAKIGYEDKLVVKGEIFHLWVIEAPTSLSDEFPANKAGLNVLFVPSEKPYHERKVTLLNGPHTVLSPVAYLSGIDTVREACEHEVIGKFIRRAMYDELLPTLDLPKAELEAFADAVLERFRNPFVKHFVTSIMLNSFPKFKPRDLPGIQIYFERNGRLPKMLVLGLAAICVYYRGGKRGADIITPNDEQGTLEFLDILWKFFIDDAQKIAFGVLAARTMWNNENLNEIPGLTDLLAQNIDSILRNGMLETVRIALSSEVK
ncbi:MAG: tagaturonate reductase [Prevotellaceae bacterium]|jgi:tagaturonate reductase|nr:tagaturonate reductase [Prevotellaceae bacterium]